MPELVSWECVNSEAATGLLPDSNYETSAFLTAVILLLPLAVVAQDNTPNLEDTVSYINSHLKKFGLAPRWPCDVKGDEDARSGQITLSEDHRTVIHVVHECHRTYIGRIPVAAVKSIHSDSIGGTTIVFLSCADKDECAEILNKNSGNASAFRSASVQVEISPNEEIGNV
jgi:hypothetical protein